MEKDIGTILRLYPLGEHGLIVCWCTEQHGLIRTAARQARKAGSDFFGRIDLFHECELVFRPGKTGELGVLQSASLLSPRLPLRANLTRLRLAGYMTALLSATVEEEDAATPWHQLIAPALDYIATAPLRPAILLHFEKRLAELHGLYSPDIPPHIALEHHFRHLPGGRRELLAQLEHTPC